MPNVYEYFEGMCSICGHEGQVRHKNIWLTGSEGTDMCWPCEKAMLGFLNKRKSYYTHKRIEEIKKKVIKMKTEG